MAKNTNIVWYISGAAVLALLVKSAAGSSGSTSLNSNAASTATDLIKKWEGYVSTASNDGFGTPTIGWGTVVYSNGQNVQIGDTITADQANYELAYELNNILDGINSNAKVPLTANQVAALASFAYNEGLPALLSSTLWSYLNAGQTQQAADQFNRWVYVHGSVVDGLVNRRADEKSLFLS